MKTKLTLLLIFSALTPLAKAQNISLNWESPIVVSSDPAFGHWLPRIALMAGDVPAIVWGNPFVDDIFFSKMQGDTFSDPVQVNPINIPAYVTQGHNGAYISTYGDTAFVSYDYAQGGNDWSLLQSSVDAGTTWGDTISSWKSTVSVDSNSGKNTFAKVSARNGKEVFVIFRRQEDSTGMAYYVLAKSIDGGDHFLQEIKLTNGVPEPCNCCPPDLDVSGNTIAVIFRDMIPTSRQVHLAISSDDGLTLDTLRNIDNSHAVPNSNCPSSGPDGYLSGDTLVAAWMTVPTSIYSSQIKTAVLPDLNSLQLHQDTTDLNNQQDPRIAGNGDTLVTAWQEPDDSGGTSITMTWSLAGLSNLVYRFIPVPQTNASQSNPDIAYANQHVHLVFQDNTNNEEKIIYIRGTFGPAAAINPKAPPAKLEIFPNPSKDFAVIQYPFINDGTIEVWNETGLLLFSSAIKGSTTRLDLSKFSEGIYLVRVTSAEKMWIGKICVR